MASIKRLPQEVINRIAAGEVIQRPLSAIKELIENSIDAKSSLISIVCEEGGFSSIEISDDGSGIDPADFPLLCERFATSKISDFTDLTTISSFGFRGEALASVSFVSHLTIKSKKESSNLGYKATFRDGIMLPETVTSIPMNKGTVISVEKLFYNLGVRRNSITFKDEFKDILRLIHKLSIHHYAIKFKIFSSSKTLEFSSCNLLSKGKQARVELISNIFKLNEKHLILIEDQFPDYKVKVEAVIAEVGSVKKNRDIIIFVNERIVECEAIKKTIDAVYKSFWVSIHEDEGGYFCYISLSMKTENIDVNVDPRKKFVKFLFETEICSEISQVLQLKLKEKCSIRTFQTVSNSKNGLEVKRPQNQTIINSSRNSLDLVNKTNNNDTNNKNNNKITNPTTNARTSDKNYVRVDPKTQKLSTFLTSNKPNEEGKGENEFNSLLNMYSTQMKKTNQNDEIILKILNLKKTESDEETTKFFHNMTYVGCLNSNYIVVQNNQNLHLINAIPICLEIFMQMTLISVGKFESVVLPEPINVKNSFLNVIKGKNIKIEDECQILKIAISTLQKEKEFLEKSFSLKFEGEDLLTFPKISPSILPNAKEIETFLFKLFNNISFDDDVLKNKRICEEIASVYAWSLECNNFFNESQSAFDEYFSSTLFPFMKKCCFFEKTQFENYSYNLLNLEDAYKIFERC